ncbi:MAG: DUF1385 domain-containing protein [Ruminococcaceae bacterium]|nr:DUF1385 domain-containing protein [Oscillospiraceae bacterium]
MSQEKFKTMIGGQALIEGIMMRGPKKDAIVTCANGELKIDVKDRKLPPKVISKIPFIRGMVSFFDAQLTGVKALMQASELAPEEYQEEPSKFDAWLEEKLGNEKFQKIVVGLGVFLGLGLSIVLFFLLPMIVGGFFYGIVKNNLIINLIEGLVRIVIFGTYMVLVSRMQEMKRVFAYHGAEHKTIRCYEAGLPLTVENVQKQTRLHPRCGTSFLLVVMVLSILVFSAASSGLLALIPALETIHGSFLYRLIMIVFKLLLLPLVVGISYEINRWVGRHDNWFSRILTAPGMWMQNFTTQEPDEDMIRTGIAALEAVIPENEGEDRW